MATKEFDKALWDEACETIDGLNPELREKDPDAFKERAKNKYLQLARSRKIHSQRRAETTDQYGRQRLKNASTKSEVLASKTTLQVLWSTREVMKQVMTKGDTYNSFLMKLLRTVYGNPQIEEIIDRVTKAAKVEQND